MTHPRTDEGIAEGFRKYVAANLNDGEYPIPKNGRLVQLSDAVEITVDYFQTAYTPLIEEAVASKDNAYHERNQLVAALTKIYPAYLARHDENDESWEKDWMWIVYVEIPSGQLSWHIHDSERHLFDHLEVKENNWDGHSTEEKYRRLEAITNPKSQ